MTSMVEAADTGLCYIKLKTPSKKSEKQAIFDKLKVLTKEFKKACESGGRDEVLRLAAIILFIQAKKRRECIDVPLKFGAGLLLSQLGEEEQAVLGPIVESCGDEGELGEEAAEEQIAALRVCVLGPEEDE